MEFDEAGALAMLEAHHEALIYPASAEHRGRVVILMGGGMQVDLPEPSTW